MPTGCRSTGPRSPRRPLNPRPILALPARIVERIAQVHTSIPALESFTSSLHLSLRAVGSPGDATDTPATRGTLTIVEKIGRGTFGDVYRAHDRRLNRPVARVYYADDAAKLTQYQKIRGPSRVG